MLVTLKRCEHTYEAKFRLHQYHHCYHLKILQSIWINLYHTRNLGWKMKYYVVPALKGLTIQLQLQESNVRLSLMVQILSARD